MYLSVCFPAQNRRPGEAPGSTLPTMKRLVLVVALLTFAWWRRNRFDEHDRRHEFGAYAPVTPV